MKRLGRDEAEVERLLRASRVVAVVGASGRRGDPADAVAEYLARAGFEVLPIHRERAEVAGLASWARLADVPGRVDIVLVVGGAGVDGGLVAEAAEKGARAVWIARGVPAGDGEARVEAHGMRLVRALDIVEEQRHTEAAAGRPRRRGARPAAGGTDTAGGGRRGGTVREEKQPSGGRRSPHRRRR